jgi:hypothetical protein
MLGALGVDIRPPRTAADSLYVIVLKPRRGGSPAMGDAALRHRQA